MTRIGFAYNQKPESTVGPVSATISESRPDEEPPSSSDVYAEWDSAETIAAVATALSAFGDVIPLEATAAFPERLRAPPPRHRLQHRRRSPRNKSRGARPRDLRVSRRSVLRQR